MKTQSAMSITIAPPLVNLSTFSKPYLSAPLNTSGIRVQSEFNSADFAQETIAKLEQDGEVGVDTILFEMVKEKLKLCKQKSVPVVLVDHGTPSLKVRCHVDILVIVSCYFGLKSGDSMYRGDSIYCLYEGIYHIWI